MSDKHPPALEVHHLTVNYDKTPVLWDISVEVPQGCLCGIVGPNGAGKSTFLKTALGLLKPISGRVSFLGKKLSRVRQKVAYIPQRESVDWDFPVTVRDLVLMGRYGMLGILRRPRRADYDAVEEVLETVGMADYADRQISQLSGGQQQRVFLARALVQDADVYLMDEPFAGIDLATEKVLVELLKGLRDRGKTVFVVHHDLNTVNSYFDWVIIMNMRLVACGPVKEVYSPDNLNTAYGNNSALFDEAFRLSQNKEAGMP